MQFFLSDRLQRTHIHTALLALFTLLTLSLHSAALNAQDTTGPCANPQRAVKTFVDAIDADPPNIRRASTCFDFSEFQGTRQEQLDIPTQLHDVLSAQGLRIDLSEIPDKPDALATSDPPFTYILLPNAFDQNLTVSKRGDRWLFTPTAISSVIATYQNTFSLGLPQVAGSLPPIFQKRLLGVALWKILSVFVLIAIAWLLSLLIALLLTRTLKTAFTRARLPWLGESVDNARRYTRLTIFAIILLLCLPQLLLPTGLSLVLIFAARFTLTAAVVLFAWKIVDDFTAFLTEKASKTDTRLDDQLIPLVRKTLKFVLVVVATLFILQNLHIDVGSLLAGLGIGGLAFAFAAKDTLSNLFGSLMIFADRPFQIGDAVQIDSVEGTIEEVGFRSTRIRTFYSSLVTIPNSTVANATIDNLGVRTARRFKITLNLSCNSSTEQIMAFVEGVRAALRAHPNVKHDGFQVYFNDISASSYDVLVYCFLIVPDWGTELETRQDLLLEFLRIAQILNIEFPYPSQTHYVIPTEPFDRAATPDASSMRSIAQSFGPGGSRSIPQKEVGKSEGSDEEPPSS